jgi:DNA polymerase-3 subunit gamma/tau
MSYQVLARKWRPRTLEQVSGQEPVLRMLANALTQKRLHHAYLFTGTRGVGKTTFARIFAKCLNCKNEITASPCGACEHCQAIDDGRFIDLLEVDAASRTKVEDTRELLENIQYQPVQGRYKIYLIDEVHMLSGHSFNALLKTLEEPPPYVKFLLATTDPKRLPVTILSRCLQLNLKQIPVNQITQRLQHICTEEKISYELPALQLIAEAASGSLRDALSLLDQAITFCQEKINTSDVRQMLGRVEEDALFRLLQSLADHDGKQMYAEVSQLAEFYVDFTQLLEHLLSLLHQINLTQVLGDSIASHEKIIQFSKHFSAEEIQLYYQIALIGRRDLPLAPDPQIGFEMVMLRLLAFHPVSTTNKGKGSSQNGRPACRESELLQENSHAPWSEILTKLSLSGMAHALAVNCILTEMTHDKVTLTLSAQQAPLLNKKLTDRIKDALIRHLGRPIQLEINLTSTEIDTPSRRQQEEETARQTTAMETIKNDSQVQKIMDIFDASLSSVAPHST